MSFLFTIKFCFYQIESYFDNFIIKSGDFNARIYLKFCATYDNVSVN